MKLDAQLYKVALISLALIPLGGSNKTEAGTVKLINETHSATEINVISVPTERAYCRKCLESPRQRCRRETATILVPTPAFHGAEYFSVIDISNGISGGECKNLSIVKNYEVSFIETTLGTRCECKEI